MAYKIPVSKGFYFNWTPLWVCTVDHVYTKSWCAQNMIRAGPSRTLITAQARKCMYLFTSSVPLCRPFIVQESSAKSPAYTNPGMAMSSTAAACHLLYEYTKHVDVQTMALPHSTWVSMSNTTFSTHFTQNWTHSYNLIHTGLIFHSFLLFSLIRNLATVKLKY